MELNSGVVLSTTGGFSSYNPPVGDAILAHECIILMVSTMRNSIVRKESILLCISFSLTLCLNISDHKNTMFFKDLGDLYLKNRKIGFWEGPFQNFIGWTGCDAQNGSTDIFVFGNIPCRVELTPAYQKHFSSQSRRRENPDDAVPFGLQSFEDVNGSVGIFFDIVLFAVGKEKGNNRIDENGIERIVTQ